MKEQNKPQGTNLSALGTHLWLCGTVVSVHLQLGQPTSILLNNQAFHPQKKLETLKPTNTKAAW